MVSLNVFSFECFGYTPTRLPISIRIHSVAHLVVICPVFQKLADFAYYEVVVCAYKFAIDTIIGTATLVEESGKHPEKLKDEVCSPGGSTIAGVVSLEKNGFRNAAVQCVLDTFKRVLDMGGLSEKDVV